MLDHLDLVHMNGRIYDPLVARFMSADPIVTDPLNGQNYNRYSYVSNNPMGATDPTGFAEGSIETARVDVTGKRETPDGSVMKYSGFADSHQPFMGIVREGSSPTTGRGGQRGPGGGSGRSKTYFIGGAADKFDEFGLKATRIMEAVYNEFVTSAPESAEAIYYGYTEREEIVADIVSLKKDAPETSVNLVGHSRGGALAYNIAANELSKANISVNLLIAIDPVGRQMTTPGLWMPSSSLDNVRFIININAAPVSNDASDWVAKAGVKYGSSAARYTPHYFEAPYNHGSASLMMHYSLSFKNGPASSAMQYLQNNVHGYVGDLF